MEFTEEQAQAALQVAREDLIDYSILSHQDKQEPYDPNWHHEDIADKLQKVESGEIKRLMIFLPPRSGKSQLSTINFPAWYLGRNPTKEVITVAYSDEFAQDFGGKTRDKVESAEHGAIFPNVRPKKGENSRSKWALEYRNEQDQWLSGGSYTAVGVGGAITGRGADVLIMDDVIKNRDEADSMTYRDRLFNWYTSTARTRLEKGGSIILTVTRWHMDDLAGRILQSEGAHEWTVVKFPMIATEKEEKRKRGDVLWPEKFNEEDVMKLKRDVGAYDFASLFQQNPVTRETQEFKPDFFQQKEEKDLEDKRLRRFLTIDSAVSKSERADYTGFADVRVDEEGFWYVKAWHERLGPKDLVDKIIHYYEQYNYEKIGIEKTAMTMVLMPYFEQEMRNRQIFLPLTELSHGGKNKEGRIRSLVPIYESGTVFHLKGHCEDLETELQEFPSGQHDDIIDALAYQTQIVKTGKQRQKARTTIPNWVKNSGDVLYRTKL